MQRIRTTTAVTSKPPYSAEGTPGFFTAGDAVAGTPATVLGQDWPNMIQEELLNVLVAAGVVPDAEDDTQLAQAILRLIAASAFTPAAATETVAGLTTLATMAEALAGAGDGAITPATMAAAILAKQGKFLEWTTATRPAGTRGLFGLNTTLGYPEWWSEATSEWVPFATYPSYSVDWLIVGGGGGGGSKPNAEDGAGGGGAGGYKEGTGLSLVSGTSYQIVIGAGGTTSVGVAPTDGNPSTFNGQTALGGGAGSGHNGSSWVAAKSGASGGGASEMSATPGSGTTGQGYAGGASAANVGGGGGGAGAVGGNAVANTSGGNGGDGISRSISGASAYYCGGGGGGVYSGTPGSGGSSVGGAGGTPGGDGAVNTGSGGGGGNSSGEAAGGKGASGVCIIRYPGAQRMTGGTVYSSGGYTYHKITSSTVVTA